MSFLNTILSEVGGGNASEMGNLAKVLLSKSGNESVLDTVVNTMKEKGMEDQVSSWVGTGENASISGSQIGKVLDSGMLDTLSEKTGLPKEQLSSTLAMLLPVLVNKLTPDGKPAGNGGTLASAGMEILKGFL